MVNSSAPSHDAITGQRNPVYLYFAVSDTAHKPLRCNPVYTSFILAWNNLLTLA